MINKLRVVVFCFFANVWTAPWRNTYKRVWSSQNIFPSNNSIEIFCCIDMEYLMRQTIFKIQKEFSSWRAPGCTFLALPWSIYSMGQYFIKAVEYCQFILFIVLYIKSLKNSITQYLLKGMEPLKYLPFKELEELRTAYFSITLEYSMWQNL